MTNSVTRAMPAIARVARVVVDIEEPLHFVMSNERECIPSSKGLDQRSIDDDRGARHRAGKGGHVALIDRQRQVAARVDVQHRRTLLHVTEARGEERWPGVRPADEHSDLARHLG